MSVFRVISNLFRFNRTNWKAVALCFFTALIFWGFTALNKNHTANINFPLQFEFDSERYVAVRVPKHVAMNVTGNGWDLLRKILGLRLPVLSVPLDKPTDLKKIPGNTLLPLVSGQIGSLKINYVVGDTINLQIDLKDSHRFKLTADLSGVSYKKGFGRISQVVILPDSVELEGPKSVLHNFSDSIVLPLSKSKVSEHFREELEVELQNGELIKRNPPVVEIQFEVGEVEEITWKLKLHYLNKPASVMIDASKDSVKCLLIVPKNQGSSILTQARGRAIIDLSELTKGESVVVPRVAGLSSIVQVVQIDSVSVKLY
jgi:YbbR domain-containing protein